MMIHLTETKEDLAFWYEHIVMMRLQDDTQRILSVHVVLIDFFLFKSPQHDLFVYLININSSQAELRSRIDDDNLF